MLNRIKQLTGFGQQSQQIGALLRAKDVKEMLNCSIPYVHKLVERGKLPCVRLPGLGDKKKKTSLRFRKADILTFIQEHYEA